MDTYDETMAMRSCAETMVRQCPSFGASKGLRDSSTLHLCELI
jgi:hypothetical protein